LGEVGSFAFHFFLCALVLIWVWLRTLIQAVEHKDFVWDFEVSSFCWEMGPTVRMMWKKTTRSVAESEGESLLLFCQSSLYSIPATPTTISSYNGLFYLNLHVPVTSIPSFKYPVRSRLLYKITIKFRLIHRVGLRWKTREHRYRYKYQKY
jgi:hypothetical protein